MIHTITLPGTQGEIYKEILEKFSISFISNGDLISAKFSSVDDAETIWSLFVERVNQIVSN